MQFIKLKDAQPHQIGKVIKRFNQQPVCTGRRGVVFNIVSPKEFDRLLEHRDKHNGYAIVLTDAGEAL